MDFRLVIVVISAIYIKKKRDKNKKEKNSKIKEE